MMLSNRTTLLWIKDIPKYFSQFNPNHWSIYFERLICQAFAGLLYLPFYDSDNDDTNKKHRVTWLGKLNPLSKATHGPDGIARTHDFCLIIEATRKTGNPQWAQEFSRCLDHARDVATRDSLQEKDVYIVLITENININTYNSVKTHNARGDFKIVLIETENLATILETACLASTIRRPEIRCLLDETLDCLKYAESLPNLRTRLHSCMESWQRKVLAMEKNVILAIRSYRAMMKQTISFMATSQILTVLKKDPVIKWYYGRLDGDLRPEDIVDSLVQESLGTVVGRINFGEELFCPIPFIEFESRCQRRLNEVEKIYGGG